LYLPWSGARGKRAGHAEASPAKCSSGQAIVLNIEDVEELRPELEIERFPNGKCLHEGEIDVVIVPRTQGTSSGVTKLIHRVCKDCSIEKRIFRRMPDFWTRSDVCPIVVKEAGVSDVCWIGARIREAQRNTRVRGDVSVGLPASQ